MGLMIASYVIWVNANELPSWAWIFLFYFFYQGPGMNPKQKKPQNDIVISLSAISYFISIKSNIFFCMIVIYNLNLRS